jgi:hypothetical protein
VGYHVTILITEDKKKIPIKLESILDAIEYFPDMEYDSQNESVYLKGNEDFVLWFGDGELYTKNPTKENLSIIISLAEKLRARVKGDYLESYNPDGTSYIHIDDLDDYNENLKHNQVSFFNSDWWGRIRVVFITIALILIFRFFFS